MSGDMLGRLVPVDLREAWKNEAEHFTPWLAKPENLQLLGETLEMGLEFVDQEKQVGPFRADILCKNRDDESWVLIENQLERTDHTHLGQVLTYAAGLEAVTIVWIAREFTEEHRAALDWLNEITDERFSFLGVEVQLWRIGDSPIAPRFNIISKPNDWSREVQETAKRAGLTDHKRLQLEFWSAFKAYMQEKSDLRSASPLARHWMTFFMGRSGFELGAIATIWDTTTKSDNPHIRVELYLSGPQAKLRYAQLEKDKAAIEREVGQPLTWYNSDEKESCKLYVKRSANYENRDEWPGIFEWFRTNLELFSKVFGPRIKTLDAPQV